MGCLYQLTSPSGKSYIGISSKTADARFAKHTEHALGKRKNGVLYSALRKYGPEKFEVKTLVIANNFEYLCDLEIKAIKIFGTRYPHGYNMTDGGEGVVGPRDRGFSELVSMAQKKRYLNGDQRQKLSEYGLKGIETTRAYHESRRIDGLAPWEQRRRASRPRRGSPEHKAKLSISVKAAHARPEVHSLLIACAKKRAADPEWRHKISESKRGKKTGPRTIEQIARQTAAIKAAWADPVKKAARLEKLRLVRQRKQ